MELIPILATVIVITTIVTVVFALLSYLTYRAKERKAPRHQSFDMPEFFRRYQPPR